jgi:hypothetical protein
LGRRRLGREGGIKMHASQYVHRNCFIYFALCATGRQNHLPFLRWAISEKARGAVVGGVGAGVGVVEGGVVVVAVVVVVVVIVVVVVVVLMVVVVVVRPV